VKAALQTLLGFLLLVAPAAVQAQFGCFVNSDNTVAITNYAGSGGWYLAALRSPDRKSRHPNLR
jgi:hypothetical protein